MVMVDRRMGAGLVLLAAMTLGACPSPDPDVGGIEISSVVPEDLPATDTDLADAAAFAWNEFIALNWPAVPQTGALNTRETADTTGRFGDPSYQGPLVWHTFRSKVELFPPQGTQPNGYVADSAQSYGYDAAPQYNYLSAVTPANGAQADTSVPWINLDETNEIGLDAMYAGTGTGQTSLNGLILFTAKANRTEYNYIAGNRYFDTTALKPAVRLSAQNVIADSSSPTPGTTANGISLPNGSIELKAAWRELTTAEAQSGRFYQTRVRYYPTTTTYVDTTMGLVALHIIHKTPSRPYFVFATFEQADNILSADGKPVEDEQGNLNPGFDTLPPMDSGPAVAETNATQPTQGYTPENIQQFSPDSVSSTPGSRLYYVNTPGLGQPEGIISVNRRVHGIPQTIIDANEAAHLAMAEYAENFQLPAAVWQHYKLINVQYQPINKQQAGVDYAGADSATYYLANSVLETDHNLQTFSGRFQSSFILSIDTVGTTIDTTSFNAGTQITDWCAPNVQGGPPAGCPATGSAPINNVYAGGNAYNMGGCMGCHGNAQVGGGDFSFLVAGGPVKNPEPANAEQAPLNTQKFSDLADELRGVRAAARASPAGTR